MLGILKQNRFFVLTYVVLLVFGSWWSSGKSDKVAPVPAPAPIARSIPEAAPVESFPVVDPWKEVVADSTPKPADFFTLLPETLPEPEPSICGPAVTLNGNAQAGEPKPMTIRTLPPESPLVDDTNIVVFSEEDDAEETEKGSKIRKPQWIPFIYFYQQSMTWFGPVKTVCIYPIPSEPPSVPMLCPSVCPPLYPVTMVPVYPVVPVMPAIPVLRPVPTPIPMPVVKPSRFGAPKFVYPNGVVVKPKVYYPNQKVRNVLRAVTP